MSVDAIVKMKLLKNYCLSLSGCELWDLCHTRIERICKAWRMGVRHVWSLPYDRRTFILQIMSDTLAMYDVICMRSLMFIKRCLSGESDVVRFIAQYSSIKVVRGDEWCKTWWCAKPYTLFLCVY